MINTKPVIKTKLKALLNELKTFKVQTILVLDYKKRNDCKIFHSSTRLIASDSGIDEALKSMHQIIMSKIKNYVCEYWIVLDVIIMVLRFLSVSIRRINSIKNGDNK